MTPCEANGRRNFKYNTLWYEAMTIKLYGKTVIQFGVILPVSLFKEPIICFKSSSKNCWQMLGEKCSETCNFLNLMLVKLTQLLMCISATVFRMLPHRKKVLGWNILVSRKLSPWVSSRYWPWWPVQSNPFLFRCVSWELLQFPCDHRINKVFGKCMDDHIWLMRNYIFITTKIKVVALLSFI